MIANMKHNLKGLGDHPQREWIQAFIHLHNDELYFHSIQDKNLLRDDDKELVQFILKRIGYSKWGKTYRFNILAFYKEYIKINKEQ